MMEVTSYTILLRDILTSYFFAHASKIFSFCNYFNVNRNVRVTYFGHGRLNITHDSSRLV